MRKFHSSLCLFHPGFLLLKLAIHRIVEEGKGPSLFQSAIFHRLSNIQTFINSSAYEMTIFYF